MAPMSNAPVTTPASRRPKRPVTLYVLVALLVVKSIVIMLVLGGVFTNSDITIGQLMRMPSVAAFIRETPAATAFLFLVAATLLVSALLLLADRRIGWLLAMVITGVSVGVDLWAFVAGTGSHLWMLLNVVTVFYLNQRDVRQRVGATLDPVADASQQAVP